MKRKYFSALLMGALTIASVSTFTSCKDYDDDISSLQSQIDKLNEMVSKIQGQIDKGAILTGVSPVENGVKLTLSNGDSYTITNGKDGAKGADGAAALQVHQVRTLTFGRSVKMATGTRMTQRQITRL